VVDDNADLATSTTILLRLAGHKVAMAHDGPSALAAAVDFHPHVVLLDLGLPGMDGYEIARRFRQDPGLAPVRLIALTGYGQQLDRERSQAAGFDHHLVKPAAPEQLEELLR
jgi:CheY-like chemotaxis protein